MKLPELIFDLIETVRNAHIVDDERLDERLVANWIHNQRSIWIKRKADTTPDYDDNILQTINATLIKVDTSVDSSLPSGKGILRTIYKIPPTIELNYGNLVLEVTSPDLNFKEFSFVPFNQFRFSGNGKFNKNSVFCAIRDGYWYVKLADGCNKTLSNLIIRAAFQTPPAVPGYDWDETDYPCNRHLIAFMKDMILKSDLNSVLSTKSDETNDGSGLIRV